MGVIEAGEKLAFDPKAAQNFLRIGPTADHLNGDALLVFVVEAGRKPYRAHASTADPPLEFVGTDSITERIIVSLVRAERGVACKKLLAELGGRSGEEIRGPLVALEKSLYLAPQFVVARRPCAGRRHDRVRNGRARRQRLPGFAPIARSSK